MAFNCTKDAPHMVQVSQPEQTTTPPKMKINHFVPLLFDDIFNFNLTLSTIRSPSFSSFFLRHASDKLANFMWQTVINASPKINFLQEERAKLSG